MPLICTYLRRPTATPLSPPPLRLILRLHDLDFLSQVAESRFIFFSSPPFSFFLLTETSQSWGGLCIVLSSGPPVWQRQL